MRYAEGHRHPEKETDYITIKIVPFIINLVETVPLDIHKFKSKQEDHDGPISLT